MRNIVRLNGQHINEVTFTGPTDDDRDYFDNEIPPTLTFDDRKDMEERLKAYGHRLFNHDKRMFRHIRDIVWASHVYAINARPAEKDKKKRYDLVVNPNFAIACLDSAAELYGNRIKQMEEHNKDKAIAMYYSVWRAALLFGASVALYISTAEKSADTPEKDRKAKAERYPTAMKEIRQLYDDTLSAQFDQLTRLLKNYQQTY